MRRLYVSSRDILLIRMQHPKYVDSVISQSSWSRIIPVPATYPESLCSSCTEAPLVKRFVATALADLLNAPTGAIKQDVRVCLRNLIQAVALEREDPRQSCLC